MCAGVWRVLAWRGEEAVSMAGGRVGEAWERGEGGGVPASKAAARIGWKMGHLVREARI